ncbi:MAG: competence protein CoiA [Proteobacteria bacterium]|nr:competence protein CoiA [Pseudomonadota bacterium]
MRNKPEIRTLKQAIRLSDCRSVSSDELLAMNLDEYHALRRRATVDWAKRVPTFACEKCGHPVYAPLVPRTKRPQWKHRSGAPVDCPWWTGDPSSVDAVSARQFQGAQESPLHAKIKSIVAECLRGDPLTSEGSVVVDEYLLGEDGRRRPDVRADHGGRPLAFEIQLATTQLPIIVAREEFYNSVGRHLIWVTWNFEPEEPSRLRATLQDIFVSHQRNIFSLDPGVVARSLSERCFYLRAFWEHSAGWQSKEVLLQDLTWPPNGLPFAVARAPAWHVDFLRRWRSASPLDGMSNRDRQSLLAELIDHIEIEEADVQLLVTYEIPAVINAVLSLVDGTPVGSRQRNNAEVVNTFLRPELRRRYARLLRHFVLALPDQRLMERPSVRDAFKLALQMQQVGRTHLAGHVVLTLFPECFPD